MKKYYVLYNPLSGNGKGKGESEILKVVLSDGELLYFDITHITDYRRFFLGVSEKDEIIVCGGDGTLNRFINDTQGVELKQKIFYFACGSGNDFLRDVGGGDMPVSLEDHIKDLPVVEVSGKRYSFLNGVGYGIDGYCCEVGDKIRARSDKPVNYTGIAVKGLLFDYKPTGATVTVDGKERRYKKVWLAPTMNGQYYGGGMLPAPEQSRRSEKLSVMVFHGLGKLKTLAIFPSIFKGEHVKNRKHVEVLSGRRITVKFDEPRTVQIDGETVRGVREYTAWK